MATFGYGRASLVNKPVKTSGSRSSALAGKSISGEPALAYQASRRVSGRTRVTPAFHSNCLVLAITLRNALVPTKQKVRQFSSECVNKLSGFYKWLFAFNGLRTFLN